MHPIDIAAVLRGLTDDDTTATVKELAPAALDRITQAIFTRLGGGAVADRIVESGLTESVRTALREHSDRDADATILAGVREIVAAQKIDGVVGVYFPSDEWDNGHFISTIGTLVFDTGSTDEGALDVHHLNDDFTEAFGTCGASAGVLVDLRAGTVTFDDYGDNLMDPFLAKIAAEKGVSA